MVLLLLAFLCKYTPPNTFWLLGILSYLVPILLLVQLGMLCFFIVRKRWKSLAISVFVLLLHSQNIYITLVIPYWNKAREPSRKVAFSVLSYNAQAFNLYSDRNTQQMLDWLAKDRADIKCFQEYYESHLSPFSDIRKRMQVHTPYTLVDTGFVNRKNGIFGLAIFSKYPIVHFEKNILHTKSIHNAFLVDLAIHGRTVRVLNIHFTSVGFRRQSDGWWKVVQNMEKGFLLRQKELKKLLSIIEQSPYPIVLCGDFNEVPYSYAYHEIRQRLNNSFEEAGSGFGFTYSSQLPLLRIDNQFTSKELTTVKFEVLDSIYYTDHLPLLGHYTWSPVSYTQ